MGSTDTVELMAKTRQHYCVVRKKRYAVIDGHEADGKQEVDPGLQLRFRNYRALVRVDDLEDVKRHPDWQRGWIALSADLMEIRGGDGPTLVDGAISSENRLTRTRTRPLPDWDGMPIADLKTRIGEVKDLDNARAWERARKHPRRMVLRMIADEEIRRLDDGPTDPEPPAAEVEDTGKLGDFTAPLPEGAF